MRIVHLIQPAAAAASPWSIRSRSESSDAGVLACAAMIAARPTDSHRVLVIGGAAARDRAAALGVRAGGCIAPTLGRAATAARAVHAAVSAVAEPDVVCGWSAGCGGILERLDRLRGSRLLIDPAAGEGRFWSARGAAVSPVELPSPGAWFAGHRVAAAAAVGPARVGLVGDPPGETDVGLLAGIVSLLRVAGVRDVVGVADRMSPGWRRARRLEAEMLGAGCFTAPDAPAIMSLAAGGFTAIDAGSSPYARAMLASWAAGCGSLPIAGEGALVDTVLPRELIAPEPDGPSLARLLLELIEDRGMRERAWDGLRESAAGDAGTLQAWLDQQLGESAAAASTEAVAS